jgi:hypothetical protein
MDNDGWVSFDFMVASLIIILTIESIIPIVEERVDTANSVQEMAEGNILAENIAETVEMVYSGGKGCSIVYKMPPAISNKPYYITVNSSGVYIRFNGKMGIAFITPMWISKNEEHHFNVVMQANKTYNISNNINEHDSTCIKIKSLD